MEQQIAQIQQLYNKIPQQIIAELNTELQNYKLAHRQLELSTELDEDALNSLLKDILQQTEIPRFQFIVQGHILRGKLKSHILRYQLTAQNTLNFQYILAFPQLEHDNKAQQEDWIAAVVTVPQPEGVNCIAAALYCGKVSLYSPSLKLLGKFFVDEEPLKALQFAPASTQNNYYCVSGGLGERLAVHLVTISDNNKNLEAVQISNNKHNDSILGIAVSPGTDCHIATGGASGQLNIWHIPEGFDQAGSFNSIKNKKKRKQTTLNFLPLLNATKVHQGSIQCLNWINDQEVVTGSTQHNIALTNVIRMDVVQKFMTRDSVVTSIDTCGDKILSAHEDGQLRLWDKRDSSRPAITFKGHSKWASSVRFGKTPLHLVSGSYDHTVKLWDLRCSFPLQNIQTQQQKVLTVDWVCDRKVVGGGSDSTLHLYAAN